MGFREKLEKLFPKGFHLTDEEIVEDLQLKVLGRTDECVIPHVDVHEQDEPWDLASMIDELWEGKLKEWCFICSLKGKYKNGKRQSRTTRSGYWKVTGKERMIRNEDTNKIIGIKKTLVFHTGRVPKGKRTNWVMHEYHLTPKYLAKHGKKEQLSYIGCRLRKKKDMKGVKSSIAEFDPADDSSSISNSSNITMESGVAEDELISMSVDPDNAVIESSALVVEDGSHNSCNDVAETQIAEIPGNEEMQMEIYPGLAVESNLFDISFSPSEFFGDLEKENGGGLIGDDDDDLLKNFNWEELSNLANGKDKVL